MFRAFLFLLYKNLFLINHIFTLIVSNKLVCGRMRTRCGSCESGGGALLPTGGLCVCRCVFWKIQKSPLAVCGVGGVVSDSWGFITRENRLIHLPNWRRIILQTAALTLLLAALSSSALFMHLIHFKCQHIVCCQLICALTSNLHQEQFSYACAALNAEKWGRWIFLPLRYTQDTNLINQ